MASRRSIVALLVQTQCSLARVQSQFRHIGCASYRVQPGWEETPPEQRLRKLSLPVADFAINLGPLVSPVQQGEMNELFIKRESSQA
jgi:hypothetical protein